MQYEIRIKKSSPTFQIKQKKVDVKVVSVGKRGLQGLTGLQGEKGDQGDPATNLVTSVNGHQGIVVLTPDDLSDLLSTNKFVSSSQLSMIASAIQPGDNISDLVNDAGFIANLSSFTTSSLAEGSNLYYTQARFNSAFAAKTTSDLTEGSNLYYTQTRFNSAFAAKTTDDLTEGSTNKYYTDDRADARISAQAGQNNGLATLGSDGKIPTSQLPALAITDTFVVASQAAMLALTAEVGDIAVRTDQNKSYILKTAGASTLGNWQELLTPTDTVLSVNGQTGTVTLTTSNISEGSNLYYTTVRVQTDGDARYVKLAGSTMTGKLTFNVSGDFAIDLGTSAVKANKIIVDGTPKSFQFPYAINGIQPETFIYLDSQFHVFRIGAQYPSDITSISFELPNNNEYQDVMSISKTSLAPAAALTNTIALGTSGNKWASLYIGGAAVIQGTMTLGSLGGVLKASSGVISGSATTSDLTEGSNLYYTDERVDDRVAALLQNGTGLSWSYNDASNTLTPAVSLASFSTSNLAEGSNLYFTNERVDDRVAALLNAGSGVTLTYDDNANSLTIAASTGTITATPNDLSYSGVNVTMTAGENVAFGDVCYLKSDGKMWKAKANAVGTSTAIFMAAATILADASGVFILPLAFVRSDTAWNWTVGGILYLSDATAGAITQTAPTATGSLVQILGIATHADRIFWNPQMIQIELN